MCLSYTLPRAGYYTKSFFMQTKAGFNLDVSWYKIGCQTKVKELC